MPEPRELLICLLDYIKQQGKTRGRDGTIPLLHLTDRGEYPLPPSS